MNNVTVFDYFCIVMGLVIVFAMIRGIVKEDTNAKRG